MSDASGRLAKKLKAVRRGRLAELFCLWHLRLRGWRIVARDYRVPSGEIDLIARRGNVLIVIEVKARPTAAEASEAISHHQRRRIARATEHFLARHPQLADLTLRFDVMLVVPGRLPRHLPNAWRIDD